MWSIAIVMLSVTASILLPACRSSGASGIQSNVHVTNIGGYIEFVAREQKQEQKSNITSDKSRSVETIFEENIKLEVEGFVYHPNFLEFTLGGLFGLIQQDFEDEFANRLRKSGDNGAIYEFDFSGHFLKKKKYPGSVYARRQRHLEPRAFQSSLETTATSYGLVWQYVSDKNPTSLQFNYNEVLLDPLDDREEPGRQENLLLRFETSYRFSDSNVLSLEYTYQDTQEEPFELDYEINELTLSHVLNFGPHRRHRLDSELNVYDQRGTFSIERFRWRETLRLEHSEDLRSWFRAELLDRVQGSQSGVPPIGERAYFVSGTLEHDLYESLRTQIYVFGQWQSFDTSADISRYGTQVSFEYRKKNPWGLLQARYSFRAENEDRSGGNQLVDVVDEQRTFNDPEPVRLMNTNVNLGSIEVISEDRLTRFRLGRDFTWMVVGNFVELERVPTGRIANGQTVLISYVYMLVGDYVLDTLQHEFDFRQRFKMGLTPYYRLLWQDQRISPTDAVGILPEDITDHTVGVEFERGSLRLSAEFEDRDSSIDPAVITRLRASYTRRFETGATGVLKMQWSDVERLERNSRRTRFFTIEGRYRHPVSKGLTVEAAVAYRRENDSLNGNDNGVDVDFSVEWFVRQTEFKLTYEYGQYEDDFSDNETSTLFVQLRRRF